eukprot:4730080-Ditylum_brightwellii.AAC.1
MLSSKIYEVDLPGGEVKEYAANIIAEKIMTHVDHEGFTTIMMDNIIYHAKDKATAVRMNDNSYSRN